MMKKRIISGLVAIASAMAIGFAPVNTDTAQSNITTVSAASVSNSSSSYWRITASSGVNVRTGPGTSYNIKGALAKGSVLKLSSTTWYIGGYRWKKITQVVSKASGSWGTISAGYYIAIGTY